LESGELVSVNGSGTYEGSGKNRWRTQLVHQLSNGRRVVSDGEIDLANRSWKGTFEEC
jgi:hypothetical protein